MWKQDVLWLKTFVRTKKVVKVGKISGKNDILTVEEKLVSIIGNKTKNNPLNEAITKKVRGKTVEVGQDVD